MKTRVAGKLRRIAGPAILGNEFATLAGRGTEHGREVGMIPGKVAFGRAVVRHSDEQRPAVPAVICQPAGDYIGWRQHL